MRSYNFNREIPGRMESAFVVPKPRALEPRPYLPNSSTRPGPHRGLAGRTRIPAPSRNGMTELLADVDGLPVLFRIVLKEAPAQPQSGPGSNEAEIYSLLSSALEKVVDRMRGSSLQSDAPSRQPLAIVELTAGGESSADRSATARIPTAKIHDAAERQAAVAGDALQRSVEL